MSPRVIKRLVLCCDGRWSPASFPPSTTPVSSNAARLSRMLARRGAGDDVPQIVLNLSGHTASLDQDVAAAYLFLAANYAPGDEIAVFGAGRGASAARIVVGLLTDAGLLRPGEVDRWALLWALYTERTARRRRQQQQQHDARQDAVWGEDAFWKQAQAHRSRAELDEIDGLRSAMHEQVRIKAVGVWDTVGRLGVPDGLVDGECAKWQLHGTAMNSQIDHAFQVLALDENRAAFCPSLWHLDPRHASQASAPPRLKQCWFPGFHETVGGSDIDVADPNDRTDIADITLAWMCDQVDGLLDFDDAAVVEFLGCVDQSEAQEEQLIKYRSTPSRRDGAAATTLYRESLDASQTQAQEAARTSVVALLAAVLNVLLAVMVRLRRGATTTATATTTTDNRGNSDGYSIRTPGQYHKNLAFAEHAQPDDLATNESIHPSVRHRKDLFALASAPYDPAPLRDWAVGDVVASKGKHGCADAGKAVPTEANAINIAAEAICAATLARPHPRWIYRERGATGPAAAVDAGEGAEWIRPSVSLSEQLLSNPSSSSLPSARPLSTLTTALPSFPKRRAPPSLLGPLFWPLYASFHLLFFILHVCIGGPVGESEERVKPQQQVSPPPPQCAHERQIVLPEWVIRELPGRRNFEARLLPWLVRMQLNRRNAKRLDWRGGADEVWTRTALSFPLAHGSKEGDVDGDDDDDEVEPGYIRARTDDRRRSPLKRDELSKSGRISFSGGTVVRRRTGPLHVRKGSAAELAMGESHGATGAGERKNSQSAGVFGGAGGGMGLKVLALQPEKRRREGKEKDGFPAFLPGHSKSHSQTSVSWR